MSILLAYNESDSWEVGKLAKATEIKEDLLVQVKKGNTTAMSSSVVLSMSSSVSLSFHQWCRLQWFIFYLFSIVGVFRSFICILVIDVVFRIVILTPVGDVIFDDLLCTKSVMSFSVAFVVTNQIGLVGHVLNHSLIEMGLFTPNNLCVPCIFDWLKY